MLEREIEQYLAKLVKAGGGYCFKWTSPAIRGVPDRIVFLNKQVWFVELKSPTGKLSKLQQHIRKQIEEHTDNYVVLNSKLDVEKFIKNISDLR